MRRTKADNISDAMLIMTAQLMQKMNCGYQTAVTIGTEAQARIYVGRRVWFNVKKLNIIWKLLQYSFS